jgi:hypothetical protein
MAQTTVSKSLLATLVVLALISAAMVFLVLKRKYDKSFWTRTTPAQVEDDIKQHVPVGSPRERVVAYLDGKKIVHEYYGADLYKGTTNYNCEVALVRHTASSWLVTTDIQVIFRFDSASKLESYKVQEVHTGP